MLDLFMKMLAVKRIYVYLIMSLQAPPLTLFYIQGIVGVRLSGFKSRLRHHKGNKGLAQKWVNPLFV